MSGAPQQSSRTNKCMLRQEVTGAVEENKAKEALVSQGRRGLWDRKGRKGF